MKWQDEVQDLYETLRILHGKYEQGRSQKRGYQDDLVQGLSKLSLTKEHKKTLIAAASPALGFVLEKTGLKQAWIKAMVDSFYDPMIQTNLVISLGLDLDRPHLVVHGLRTMQKITEEVHTNYKTLLGKSMQPAVRMVMELQDRIASRIPSLVDRILQDPCMTVEEIESLDKIGPINTANGTLHFSRPLPSINWQKTDTAAPRNVMK